MEGAENGEIPNLSGKVTLCHDPVFDGSYSKVYCGTLGDKFVAVKVLKEIRGAEVNTMLRKFHRERTIWGRLRHPNVLQLYGFANDDFFQPFGALISPWRAQGNAHDFLKANGQSMPPVRRLKLWKGVVAGVAYLHNLTPALVHGDLKPLNVLIDDDNQPQICDFGLVSIFLDDGTSGMKTTSLYTGTDRYLAYELVLDGDLATPTMASDVFALGSVGLEFNFLQIPYANRRLNRHICIDIRAMVPPANRPQTMDMLGGKTWDLLDRCWEQNSTHRINARDLLSEVESVEHTLSETLTFPPSLQPLLPLPTPEYVERRSPMEFIEKTLFEEGGKLKRGSKIVTITGIGGCGKTRLVQHLVEQCKHHFASIFFIDGSSPEAIRRDIVRHVRALGGAHSQRSFEESMIYLSRALHDGERLLAIDNVDDHTLDLAPFIPQWQNGVVIISGRNHLCGQLNPADHLQLDFMTLDESVELLVRGSGQPWPPTEVDKILAISVADELRCHPIALVQAIGYMHNTGCSPSNYITLLRNHRDRLLRDPSTSQVDMRYKAAFAAFDGSYDVLPPKARDVLHLFSLFSWQKLPLELVSRAALDGFSTDRYAYLTRGDEFGQGVGCLKEIFYHSGEWDPLGLDSIITTLRSHSLISQTSAENVTLLQMHPLVHEWGRLRISEGRLRRFEAAAVRLLCCGATKDNHSMVQYLSSHAEKLSCKWDNLHPNDASSLAVILAEAGVYDRAATLDRAAHEVVKRELGPSHLKTLTSSANLAVSYAQLGRYAEVELLQAEVLRQRKQKLGLNHLHTIHASENLAATYHELGRYAEAEELDTEVLRRRRQLLGANHPDTLSASENLAATYRELGRYAEAEVLDTEVLLRRKQSLGADHRDTISASENLAATYHALGRHAEAAELSTEVLRQRKHQLGVDHPDTVRASAELADTCQALGRYAEAEMLQIEVLQQRKQSLGVRHPDTIWASAQLADTYHAIGRYAEAEMLQTEVLQQRRQLMGEQHPATITASANLAVTYYRSGRFAEAEELELEVLRMRTAVLGDRHPNTIRSMLSLAYTYNATQRGSEASSLAQTALQIALETVGGGHPLYNGVSAFLASLPAQESRRDRFKLFRKRRK